MMFVKIKTFKAEQNNFIVVTHQFQLSYNGTVDYF